MMRVVFFVLTASVGGAVAHAQGPGFYGIGDLPGATFSSQIQGLSGNGLVAVGRGTGTAGPEAVRWSPGIVLAGLGDLPGGSFSSQAHAVSATGGTIAGVGRIGIGGDSVSRASRWVDGGAPEDLGTLRGQAGWSSARGVSGDGSVIVGSSENPARSEEAFRWTLSGGMVGLGLLPGASSSVAEGVSGDGIVVVGHSSNRAFRWSADSGILPITPQPGATSTRAARAVSFDGTAVVGIADLAFPAGGREAFLATESGTIGLGWLPFGGTAPSSEALGVNADASVVVGVSSNQAFIWDAQQGMRRLRDALLNEHAIDVGAWNLERAVAISHDGMVIAGSGFDPMGRLQGWVVVLPSPGGVVAAGVMGAFLIGQRRRRRVAR